MSKTTKPPMRTYERNVGSEPDALNNGAVAAHKPKTATPATDASTSRASMRSVPPATPTEG